MYVLITWFGLGIATISQPLGTIYPYFASLACCRRIFRRAEEVASIATSVSANGDISLIQQPTSGSLSSSQHFLPSSALHHHTNDRVTRKSDRDKMNGGDRSNTTSSSFGRHRRSHTQHSKQLNIPTSSVPSSAASSTTTSMNTSGHGVDDESDIPTHRSPPSMNTTLSEDEEELGIEHTTHATHHPSTTTLHDEEDRERERDVHASHGFGFTDSDSGSMYSDLHLGPFDSSSGGVGGASIDFDPHSAPSSRPSTAQSVIMSRSAAHTPRAATAASSSSRTSLSTMAQLRNASKRIKAANRDGNATGRERRG